MDWKSAKPGHVLNGFRMVERGIRNKAGARALAEKVSGEVWPDGEREWAVMAKHVPKPGKLVVWGREVNDLDPLYAEWLCENDPRWSELEDIIADEELSPIPNPERIDAALAEMEIIEFNRLAEYQATVRGAPDEQLYLFES